jgi:hypothetical protein
MTELAGGAAVALALATTPASVAFYVYATNQAACELVR